MTFSNKIRASFGMNDCKRVENKDNARILEIDHLNQNFPLYHKLSTIFESRTLNLMPSSAKNLSQWISANCGTKCVKCCKFFAFKKMIASAKSPCQITNPNPVDPPLIHPRYPLSPDN